MGDTSGAEALIRDARKQGQAKAVREILDALSKARPKREGWVSYYTVTGSLTENRLDPDLHRNRQEGFDEAVRVVKAYKVSNDA